MRIGPLTVTQVTRCEVCGERTPADGAHCIGCGAALPATAPPGAYTGTTQPLRWPDPDDPDTLDDDQASRIARALGVPRLLLVAAILVLAAAVFLSTLPFHGPAPVVFEQVTICFGM